MLGISQAKQNVCIIAMQEVYRECMMTREDWLMEVKPIIGHIGKNSAGASTEWTV